MSQGFWRWNLLHTEPGAATPAEQKVMTQIPPRVLPSPTCEGPAYLLSWACRSSSLDSICPGL